MKKKFDYDLIVLGSGSAGASAALFAAGAGQKVALVENGKWGGSALNGSDIPRRATFEFSHLYSEARRGSRFGLSSASLRYNFPTVVSWRSLAARRAGAGSKRPFEDAKIACVSGFASFLSPYEVAVGDKILASQKFVLATGSKPAFDNISGVESATCLTPEAALALPRPPKSVFIVGAGSTGCELAEYFAELGSSVILADLAGRLLPREDEEVGQLLGSYFETSLRIKVLTQSRVVAIEKLPGSGLEQKVVFLRGGQEKSVKTNLIVLATGSRPVTDFGLENAGVKFDKSGITVDDTLRTSMKHIYAAGDCLGGESSAERAAYEGALAASNLLGKTKNLRNYEGFIRVTDTFPSVATTGLTEDDCVKQGLKCQKAVLPLSSVSAANTSDFRYGFVKLLADSKDKLLGATVVCPSAELVIQEVATAVRHKFTVTQLASTPHVSSSWSELVHLAAKKLAQPKK
ncbi:NAD(P)/FAD-dependent oxidoreductase [Candidatus Saccharibacteria bacterium]|nr:NAD(P)/FAD-dependent oxidoreductase [Candidatus Saccharibacteria bacterium]